MKGDMSVITYMPSVIEISQQISYEDCGARTGLWFLMFFCQHLMLQIFQYATKLSCYISKEGQIDQTFAKTGSYIPHT